MTNLREVALIVTPFYKFHPIRPYVPGSDKTLIARKPRNVRTWACVWQSRSCFTARREKHRWPHLGCQRVGVLATEVGPPLAPPGRDQHAALQPEPNRGSPLRGTVAEPEVGVQPREPSRCGAGQSVRQPVCRYSPWMSVRVFARATSAARFSHRVLQRSQNRVSQEAWVQGVVRVKECSMTIDMWQVFPLSLSDQKQKSAQFWHLDSSKWQLVRLNRSSCAEQNDWLNIWFV